jgi:hypothetical protein
MRVGKLFLFSFHSSAIFIVGSTSFHVLVHIKHCVGAPVSYREFLAELERAGLSVRCFAELIGMNPNSITNYAGRGDLPQHIALIAVLVSEFATRGLDYRKPIAKVAPTKKPRGATRPGHFGGDSQASLALKP